MFHDASDGKLPFQGTDAMEAQCPSCGHESPYSPDEFTSMRAIKRFEAE